MKRSLAPLPSSIGTSKTEVFEPLRQICRQSLLAYTEWCDARYISGDLHKALALNLEDVAARKQKRVIISVPPRHGKSRLVSIELPTWVLGKAPDTKIIVASYSANLSVRHSKAARERLHRGFYRELFPGVELAFGDQSSKEWTTEQGGGYKATSVGGSLTGHGADILIVDDPFSGFAEAHSATIREKVWDWFLTDAYTRLSPDGVIIITATRWHPDDLTGRLTDEARQEELRDAGLSDEAWKVINYQALAEENDPLGRKEGEALFPDRWPARRLKQVEVVMGAYKWSALYRGKPVRKGGNYIEVDKLNVIEADQVPKQMIWVRAWDLATTEKASADYTAGGLGAIDQEGNFYLKDFVYGQWAWPKARTKIALISRAEKVLLVLSEIAMGRGVVQNLMEEVSEKVKELTCDKDKLTRALPWMPLAGQGKMFLVRGEWNTYFITQASEFPTGAHDDLIDVVSLLYEQLVSFFPPIRLNPDTYSTALARRRQRHVLG